jgi:hypothetical protein
MPPTERSSRLSVRDGSVLIGEYVSSSPQSQEMKPTKDVGDAVKLDSRMLRAANRMILRFRSHVAKRT